MQTLDRAAELLKANPDEVAEKLERLLATHKDMERRLAELDRKSADSDAAELAQAAVDVDGTRLVVARRDIGVDALRSLAQTLKSKLGSGVIVLGAAGEGRANLVGAVTKDLAAKGISARDLLAPGAKLARWWGRRQTGTRHLRRSVRGQDRRSDRGGGEGGSGRARSVSEHSGPNDPRRRSRRATLRCGDRRSRNSFRSATRGRGCA